MCDLGFELYDGKCVDHDECNETAGICGDFAQCFNTLGSFSCKCHDGFTLESFNCRDINECQKNNCRPHAGDCTEAHSCGPNEACINTIGSYHCICKAGFTIKSGAGNFTLPEGLCEDVDECLGEHLCGPNAACINTPGSYRCICNAGYAIKSGANNFTSPEGPCEAGCSTDGGNYCGNGTCQIGDSGPYCACNAGFTNYGHKAGRCTVLDCDVFKDMEDLEKNVPVAYDLVMQLKRTCVNLTEGEAQESIDDQEMLSKFLAIIDLILATKTLNDNRKVSVFLNLAESALRLMGPLIKAPTMRRFAKYTELDLLSYKKPTSPQGVLQLITNAVTLKMQLETVAGDPSQYPGFASAALLSYANLETFTDGFYGGMNPRDDQRLVINSKVATVSVTNTNTNHLRDPVELGFYHLKKVNDSHHVCVFWDTSQGAGSWSADGCTAVKSDSESTVCSCNHLSTFAVLMALYDVEEIFELQLLTSLGLSLSLICLLICILTFSLVRSIQSTRTTIHLHLCISLFVVAFVFLVGITRTENQSACATIAGLLHFFFLAAFCWMCLEGIQLFRMVILVFNTNFRTSYMMTVGYGIPAMIVAISASVNPRGYGTPRYCWLNVKFIWSFLGPACAIIAINIFFFVITVWKLAQKFSSLNPDLNTLQKIQAFTVTAVAQLCVLGTTWIFGCFQFDKSTVIMSYLFTIFASLQGVMLFVMHCLFSKQVRDEYRNFLSRFSVPSKKTCAEVNLLTGIQHASRSSQDTGESHT
ncbi:adhesion G protein-coupled receptor E2 isoform X2 [Corythoichthys intestinalis]|nr:adhesion G protein-coupled receptor E2 isoform X2 [Corythoichthys intestinalis]